MRSRIAATTAAVALARRSVHRYRARSLLVGLTVVLTVVGLGVGPSVAFAGGGNSLNAQSCQKNGWRGLVRSTGATFVNQDACVSYAAKGGTLYKSQTITFGALSNKTFGDPDFTVGATSSSGLAVTFTASGSCTVTGTSVHLTGAGPCTITAHQAGNATWYPAPDVARVFSVGVGSQTISFTSTNPSPVLVGSSGYTPTAVSSSGLTVSITLDGASTGCSLSGGVVSFDSAGTCLIDANQAGNADWNAAAQQQQSITVGCISTDAQLRAAAAAGGTFCLSDTPISLTGGEIAVGSTLTLTSDGSGNATVTALQNSRVFNVTGQLTLDDVTVTGGQVRSDGGGIMVGIGASVVLNGNTSVTGNSAHRGGGVFVRGGTLTMNNAASVDDNHASPLGDNVVTGGGGVYLDQQTATLVMNDTSAISGNQVGGGAVSLGGGVAGNDSHATLNDSASISGNQALVSSVRDKSDGGGFYFVNGGSLGSTTHPRSPATPRRTTGAASTGSITV